MESKSQTKQVFANLQDLLASLPERERFEFRKYLEKHEIIGNQTLEPIILFQYNAALYADSVAGQLKSSADVISERIATAIEKYELFRSELENAIQSQVNIAIDKLNGAVGQTVEKTNDLIIRLNVNMINQVENVSSYIDAAMAKMLDQMLEERVKGYNEINQFFEAMKAELETEIKKMIISIVQEQMPTELKKAVKQPIATHLKEYLALVKERTSSFDRATQGLNPWSVVGLIRDFVVFGGTIMLFKVMHFI